MAPATIAGFFADVGEGRKRFGFRLNKPQILKKRAWNLPGVVAANARRALALGLIDATVCAAVTARRREIFGAAEASSGIAAGGAGDVDALETLMVRWPALEASWALTASGRWPSKSMCCCCSAASAKCASRGTLVVSLDESAPLALISSTERRASSGFFTTMERA